MTPVDPVRGIRSFGAGSFYAARAVMGCGALVALHLAALWLLYRSEYGLYAVSLALFAWAFLNCVWLVLLRRPGMAAALSFAMTGVLILLSQFKFEIHWMTVSFFDVFIIDQDTVSFLVGIFPQLRSHLLIAALVAVPLAVLIWRHDPFRIRPRVAALAGAVSFGGMTALSLSVPEQPWEPFQGVNHLSNFARSGVTAVTELITHGMLEADPAAAKAPVFARDEACRAPERPPHIVMVLDESSFDITAAPGIKVPADYRRHFQSFDGRFRSLVMEATGGPTWYAEYNVLTGLSANSFGRFKFYVTRLAAGRVERGLPQALRRCGYKTVTLYPSPGAFLGARRFQQTTGVERFVDQGEMRANYVEPDRFYYEQALRTLRRERGGGPLFLFVYLTANHFPWDKIYRRDLTPEDWQAPGNSAEVDEYLRRQTMSALDYGNFLARLQREFPDEPFLLVRFGDHQPALAAKLIDPALDEAAVAKRVAAQDLRYFTTYYAIDTVNFQPAAMSSALKTLEAPHLPLVILEAAGLPLDPTFAEQKAILARCGGYFYRCAGGAEARRFNRMLIDSGLIKGL
jgi:hypothetical protein